MTPIRVLHTTASLDVKAGGPVTALVGLAIAQQAAGMDVRIVYTPNSHESDAVPKKLTDRGICCIAPVGGVHLRPRLSLHLRDLLFGEVGDADVIHIHGCWEMVQVLSLGVAAKLSRPAIFRPCGMLDRWALAQGSPLKRVWYSKMLGPALEGASALHLATERERTEVMQLGIPVDHLVIPNGIELPKQSTDRKRCEGSLRLLFLGRIHPKKGLDLLLLALRQMKSALAPARLTVAGPIEDVRHHQRLLEIIHGGIGSTTVEFVGPIDPSHRAELFARHDLLVLPSYQENFGNVVVEAAASGLPSLVSDKVYLSDELHASNAGFVFPLERGGSLETNVSALASALRTLCQEPERISEAANQSRNLSKRFEWCSIASRWVKIYTALIDQSR